MPGISKITIIISLIAVIFLAPGAKSSDYSKPMIEHPEWYIEITDWTIYSTWSAVAIIHHVTIENTSDIPYKDVLVRVRYYQTAAPRSGTQIAQETGVLPVTLPPHSKDTYLRNGSTLGMASMSMYPNGIEVLGAVPVLQ
jgi:hypothetical protein